MGCDRGGVGQTRRQGTINDCWAGMRRALSVCSWVLALKLKGCTASSRTTLSLGWLAYAAVAHQGWDRLARKGWEPGQGEKKKAEKPGKTEKGWRGEQSRADTTGCFQGLIRRDVKGWQDRIHSRATRGGLYSHWSQYCVPSRLMSSSSRICQRVYDVNFKPGYMQLRQRLQHICIRYFELFICVYFYLYRDIILLEESSRLIKILVGTSCLLRTRRCVCCTKFLRIIYFF